MSDLSWKSIKALIMDSDGVLTERGIYFTSNGDELRRFDVRDGTGISLLISAGYQLAIISASASTPVVHRAQQLGISEIHIGVKNKAAYLKELSNKLNIDLKNTAYIGDDYADLEALELVGFPITTADGIVRAKEIAKYTTKANGGHGALREIAELILIDGKDNEHEKQQ